MPIKSVSANMVKIMRWSFCRLTKTSLRHFEAGRHSAWTNRISLASSSIHPPFGNCSIQLVCYMFRLGRENQSTISQQQKKCFNLGFLSLMAWRWPMMFWTANELTAAAASAQKSFNLPELQNWRVLKFCSRRWFQQRQVFRDGSLNLK